MRPGRRGLALVGLGFASLLPYAAALQFNDLRAHTVGFEFAFFAAFGLYLLAVVLVARDERPAPTALLVAIFGFGVGFRGLLVFSTPTLTDDMYRYVWDGRVQANGINSYAYPPGASELAHLRDDELWPLINRKEHVSIYPAGAQLAFAGLWWIWPDSVRWTQIAMASGDLLAGGLLVRLLWALGQPPQRALIYLWSPLAVFETAHAAHVDALVLPCLVGAWLARARGRDGLAGALLGAATALKLYTAILLPALWRSGRGAGPLRTAWKLPLAFGVVLGLSYVPYLSVGTGMFVFFPTYFTERFNPSLARLIVDLPDWPGGQPERVATGLLLAVLAVIGTFFVVRPAATDEQAIRRCIWPIGALTLLTQILWPWYLLWLVPLVAVFLRPGRLGLRLDAWTGWYLFSGLVMLSYTWYIAMSGLVWTFFAQYGPLYALLVLPPIFGKLRQQRRAPSPAVG